MEIQKLEREDPRPLIYDYLGQAPKIAPYFDYSFKDENAYHERLKEIKNREYDRSSLVEALKSYNSKWTADPAVFKNIERLSDPEAVAIVAGQQAGLLTGPAFAFHKCLSVIKLAEEKEQALGVPVVPVFWIAGEDHDIEEVNHINTIKNNHAKKLIYRADEDGRRQAAQVRLEGESLERWVEDVFSAFGETAYTAELKEEVLSSAKDAETFTEFFAALCMKFFSKYGLVLYDSGEAGFRSLQSFFFADMIKNRERIAAGVADQLTHLENDGYEVQLDQTPDSSNLFLDTEYGRELLTFDQGRWVTKITGEVWAREELLELAEKHPEKLSNNVVTRPLMQDLMFPVLAFIGGPGEISYWSALAPAFHATGIKMPPVVPRLHLTFVDRVTNKWLERKALSAEDFIDAESDTLKSSWLSGQHDYPIARSAEKLRSEIKADYQPFKALAEKMSPELKALSEKNIGKIIDQIDFMEKKMDNQIRREHTVELDRFDHAAALIRPSGQPQDRFWNIFYFLNLWGPDLVDRLYCETFTLDGAMRIVNI